MGIVSSLGVSLFADIAPFDDSIKQAAQLAQDAVGGFVDFGSKLTDLSAKTSIGTTELQKLAYAGSLVGVSMEQIASAATMLDKRIGSGSSGTVGAVAALNLNLDQLKGADTFTRFATVAQAFGQIENATQRAAVGSELFGRAWATILPLAKEDIHALGEEAESTFAILGEDMVRVADSAGDAFTRLSTSAKTLGSVALGTAFLEWERAIGQLSAVAYGSGLVEFFDTIGHAAGGGGVLPRNVKNLADMAPGRPSGFAGGIDTPVMNAKEIAEIEKELNRELRQSNTELDRRARSYRENATAAREFNISFGSGLGSVPGQQIPWKMPEPTFLPQVQTGISGSIASHVFGVMSFDEYMRAFPPPPPALFESLAQKMGLAAQPSLMQVGFMGARGILDSLGQGIATGDWSGFTSALSSGLQNFATSAIVSGINMLIPGLGSLLSPLISGLTGMIAGLFDRHKGRDEVVGFAESMGGFDALHAKLLQLGADGEALWIKLTQGVPSGNKDAAMAAIQQVINALNQQKVAGAAATDGLLTDLGAVPGAAGAAAMSLAQLEAMLASIQQKMGGNTGVTGGGFGGDYSGGIIDAYSAEVGRRTTGTADGSGLWNPESKWGPNWQEQIRTEAANQGVVNVTVNGTADREFASLLAREISAGGGLRTQWQGAVA